MIADHSAEPAAPTPTILIVDDDPVMLRLLGHILAAMGTILSVSSGEEALTLLRERPVDLVLLDVDMPGISGFEVCATIMADPGLADLPVLFISGHHDVETEKRGLEAGAVDYILKPPNPPIVRARVRTQLALRLRTQQLLRLASVDGLTGLANRRAFDQTLALEWRRARRNHTPLSLVMIDIDYFKPFNDRYGHQAGDDCLRDVAVSLGQAAERPGELVARYGGEEFAVILPFCAAEAGLALAEKMRQRVAGLALPHEKSPIAGHVTISAGVATLDGDMPTEALPDEASLIQAADRALYTAKAGGRDRVEMAKFA